MRRALRIVLLSLLLLPAGPAFAQVAAPSMVEDDLQPEEVKPPPPRPEPKPVPEAPPPPKPAETPPAPPQARAIEPVRASWQTVTEAWFTRRRALREADGPGAQAAAAKLLDAKRELAIENLFPFAAAEVREAERCVRTNMLTDAVEHAELAVQLAPDLADAHMALGRVRLARKLAGDPNRTGSTLTALGAALAAAMREPHTVRAILGDLLAALLAALAATGAVAVVVLFVRRLRVFLHDFGHLPVVRAAAPVQVIFLAAAILALPLALGFGPWSGLAAITLAAWLYLAPRERVLCSLALATVATLPWIAQSGARLTAWTGSLAEEVFELEHGGDGGERAARLAARGDLPAPALLAIGRFHKRRGDLDQAMVWYARAAEKGGRTPELLVAEGNVKFLRDDVDGARAAWLDATDRPNAAPATIAAAQYNLSKLYLRQSALDQSQQARRRAQLIDEDFVASYGSDGDFRANRWILDAPLRFEEIEALAAADGGPKLAGDAVRARLAGAMPPSLWPWAPLAAAVLPWLLVPFAAPLRPSRACERCGRPACSRCDAANGTLCGQCVNVFSRKAVVDARDRARKEGAVRRHGQLDRWIARLLALLTGGAGYLWQGEPLRGALVLLGVAFPAFLLVLWRGLIPPPHPSPYVLWGKVLVAGPIGLLIYGLSLRRVLRGSRS